MTVRLSGSHGTWSLPEGSIAIGRGRDCTLCIPEPRLSRRHACLYVTATGVSIDDLASTNGVQINQSRIAARTSLRNGDLITLGPCLFTLTIDLERPLASRLEILATATHEHLHHGHSDTEPMNPLLPDEGPGSGAEAHPVPSAHRVPSPPAPSSTPSRAPTVEGSGATAVAAASALERDIAAAISLPLNSNRVDKHIDPSIAAVISSGDPIIDVTVRPPSAVPTPSSTARRPSTDSLRPDNALGSSGSGSTLAALRPGTPTTMPGTDTLMPADATKDSTSALDRSRSDRGLHGKTSGKSAEHSSTLLPSEHSPLANDALQENARFPGLADPSAGTPGRWRRLKAILCDGLQIAALSLALSVPVAISGYVAALGMIGVQIVDGLPVLTYSDIDHPSPWRLITAMFHAGGMHRVMDLVDRLYTQNGHPFQILFLSFTVAATIFTLTILLATIAASVLHGAPYWHRRFAIVLVERRSGEYAGWGRSTLRWMLLALSLPLAVPSLLLGWSGLHDLISGCELRLRPRAVSPVVTPEAPSTSPIS